MNNIDWALLLRRFRNEQTPEEETVFMDWLNADSRHKVYYERLQREWDSDRQYRTDLPKVLAGFDVFLRKQRRLRLARIRRWWTAAAMVVCALGMASLYYRHGTSTETALPSASLRPGENKAILLLADGTDVRLDKTTDTTAVVMNEAKIDRDRGIVTFSGSQEKAPAAYNTIIIPRGAEYQAVLEDGTRVWLNAGTQLKIPAAFEEGERRVILSGEAYFEVAHEAHRPFIVETDLGRVRVFGTEFNIRRYADEAEIKTTLVDGSVGFCRQGDEAEHYVKITPGYQVRYAAEAGVRPEIRKVNTANEIAWRNRRFCFERCPLEHIMRDVGRWYDADIVFTDDALRQLQFTVTLNRYDDISVLLRYFEEASDVRFHIQGKNITVSGK